MSSLTVGVPMSKRVARRGQGGRERLAMGGHRGGTKLGTRALPWAGFPSAAPLQNAPTRVESSVLATRLSGTPAGPSRLGGRGRERFPGRPSSEQPSSRCWPSPTRTRTPLPSPRRAPHSSRPSWAFWWEECVWGGVGLQCQPRPLALGVQAPPPRCWRSLGKRRRGPVWGAGHASAAFMVVLPPHSAAAAQVQRWGSRSGSHVHRGAGAAASQGRGRRFQDTAASRPAVARARKQAGGHYSRKRAPPHGRGETKRDQRALPGAGDLVLTCDSRPRGANNPRVPTQLKAQASPHQGELR